MNLMKTLALAFLCVMVLSSCTSTDVPEANAELLSMTLLTQSPGYSWFVAEMATFSPNVTMVADVNAAMSSQPNKKVLIFVKPSCSCRGTQRLFPQVMKTLVAANVDPARIEIWSMHSASDKQPYQSIISLADLPAIYVIENGTIRARVIDADYTESKSNADTLIARAMR